MEWHPSSFEPNLKFASKLKGDLKTKYIEQHEQAKKALENFSCSLQNIFLEHQKLLNEKIELSVTNEKLREIIDSQKSNQQVVAVIKPPSSEILGASPNCKLQKLSKLTINEKRNNFNDKSSSIVQKENISELPPIYSEDFEDIENGSFITHKSPSVSVTNSPIKIQSSPIFSKCKRSNSRKSNSSLNISSQSIDSNNDSKLSSANASSFEQNIDIDYDQKKEFAKEYKNEPLKPIENILQSPIKKNKDVSVTQKILNVSKINYTKTEFHDKGKKSKQTVLSFKKVAPIMDVSKIDLNESLGNKSVSLSRKKNSWSETFYDNSIANQHSDSILENMKKFNSPRNGPKEFRTSIDQNIVAKEDTFYDNHMTNENSDSIRNDSIESRILNNQNTITKDDSVEISPLQNERSSKLKNKFNFIEKSNLNNVKEKNSQLLLNEKLSFTLNNNILQQKCCLKNGTSDEKNENNINLETDIPQKISCDETYFSQAEMTNQKDMTNFEIDLTDFEDDMQCDTPPAKKKLLNSFDVIPGRADESLSYAYKEGPVRKKSEREKLEGWDCRDCKEYYKNIPEKDRKKRQNLCSRHRGKYKPENPETPPSFWNPVFSDSEGDLSIFHD
ncbi:DNA endonuclease RBBP8-like [Phymastichus coffea]|uniref:DNA endonuclease RBBP8-like n=1 Tax=Phymastichus coffea TaxID=108790 RepID=UPI00273B12F1|nr:DNA endonuclease RBBP8-like [Phymastichus coffea]